MAKEVIRPEQFARSQNKSLFEDIELELNPEQMQELSDLYEGIFDAFKPGKIITGKVIQVDSDGVLVDIEFKSRGLVPKYEFGEHELKALKAGDELEVMIDTLESPDGSVVLSYEKAKAMRAWNDIMKHYEAGEPVHGVVTHKVKGGLSVDIGIPAFLPGSQIDLQRVTDFDQFVGQTIPAKIIKVNQKRGNVIISRRKYLGDLRSESRKQIIDTLSEGQVIQGIVKNITNYGVFIDIGGLDGLLHITDMTWGRIAHPSEMVKIGDTITVKVLSFDKENEKISLGLKQLNDNPWAKVESELEVGKQIKGRVSSITDYGLFVEVAKDIEGLVHISEISWTDRINDLHKRFQVGDEVKVLIVSIDTENRRMSLSIKQLEDNPWESIEQQFKISDTVKGKISNITDFGIFIQILPGIDGLVHISDLSWTEHIDHPRDRYAIGDEVDSVILAIDKSNKKISLGIKQLLQDPWDAADTDYPVNSVVEGIISKITNFGAFAKLPSGIEGLVHNSVIAAEQNKKADEVFKVGEKHQLRVINVSKKERKLGLSTKLEGTTREEREAKPKKPFISERRAEAPRAKGSLQIALESAFKKDDDTSDETE